jgi:hypothetical protein
VVEKGKEAKVERKGAENGRVE